MPPALLEALLADDGALAEQLGAFAIPEDLRIPTPILQLRLDQIRAKPAVQPWLLRAIVLRDQRVMCGYIGFHAEPAAAGLELGYTIGAAFRRQGFAKEAVVALVRWAFESHAQRHFRLSIAPDNVASLALARSLGFALVGSQIDEEDGVEWCFERHITE